MAEENARTFTPASTSGAAKMILSLQKSRARLPSSAKAAIKENKTVYLSTHTPLGYENLESQKIMELPEIEESPVAENKVAETKVEGTVWVCSICGYEHVGDEPPAVCPRCKQPSTAFRKKN